MLFGALYLMLCRLVRLTAGSSNDLNRDIELTVLRHQLMVLKRQVGKPRLRRRDRPADAPSVAPGAGAEEVDLPSEARRRQAADDS